MFVLVVHGDLEGRGFRRYLYANQVVVREPAPFLYDQAAVIYCPDANLAKDLRDRYSSGLLGAKLFSDEQELNDYIAENA